MAGALGHTSYTKVDDLDALREAIRDAVPYHFDDSDRPKAIRLHFVREDVSAT